MSDLDDRIRSHQIELGMRAAEAIEREDKDSYDTLKERSDLLDEAQATAHEAMELLRRADPLLTAYHNNILSIQETMDTQEAKEVIYAIRTLLKRTE